LEEGADFGAVGWGGNGVITGDAVDFEDFGFERFGEGEELGSGYTSPVRCATAWGNYVHHGRGQ
jgi:hypothetical protein